ncbi:hypothetical protein C8J57DRAFT_1227933 [Mycena rebaudengoi]|nr:hypothetical protein C8J57DRAFT_1227933 [Mycena rebaudengoi]
MGGARRWHEQVCGSLSRCRGLQEVGNVAGGKVDMAGQNSGNIDVVVIEVKESDALRFATGSGSTNGTGNDNGNGSWMNTPESLDSGCSNRGKGSRNYVTQLASVFSTQKKNARIRRLIRGGESSAGNHGKHGGGSRKSRDRLHTVTGHIISRMCFYKPISKKRWAQAEPANRLLLEAIKQGGPVFQVAYKIIGGTGCEPRRDDEPNLSSGVGSRDAHLRSFGVSWRRQGWECVEVLKRCSAGSGQYRHRRGIVEGRRGNRVESRAGDAK